MRNYGGFSDRTGLGGPRVDEAGALPPDSYLPVTLVLNLITDRPHQDAIRVSDTSIAGITAWLPRSKIKVEPVALGRTIRVTMPLWLAREKNLAPGDIQGQGSLF